MFQIINCPNCKRKIKAILKENRWVKWIEVSCEDCGYRKNIENFDFIQPDSPFFKAVYGNNPIEKQKQEIRNRNWAKENLKDKREIELQLRVRQGFLKPWELKDIKSYTRERRLE